MVEMNKYAKWIYENEIVYNEKNDLKLDIIMLKLKKKMKKYYDKESYNRILTLQSYSLLTYIIFNLSTLPDKLSKYVIKNIINGMNKTYLINLYMYFLCKYLMNNNEDEINLIIDSFNKSGLINNIKWHKENKCFVITMIDGNEVKFSNLFDDEKMHDGVNRRCHHVTYDMIRKCSDIKTINAVTVRLNNLIDGSRFHSFILSDDTVIDFAQNIIIKLDSYKKLFNPKILLNVKGKELLKEIENLKEEDIEYKDNNGDDLLYFVAYKSMKKNNNY